MKDEAERLPDRAQIEAIYSVGALEQLLADVQEAKLEIESQLEYSSRDEEWEKRAIGALAAHRICEHNIRRQLSKLSGRGQNNAEAEATRALAKAENAKAAALQVQAAAIRKQTVAMTARTMVLQGIRNTLDRGDFLSQFHAAAHDMLTEEQCRALHAEAQRRQRQAVTQLVEGEAGAGALAAE